LRFWIFVVGVAIGVAVALPDTANNWRLDKKRESSFAVVGYWFWIFDLYCLLQIAEFQHAVVAHTSAPDALAWVVAAVGVLVVAAMSVIAWVLTFGQDSDYPVLVWLPALIAFLGSAIVYAQLSGRPSWGHSFSELW
jgi:hypothetical protein